MRGEIVSDNDDACPCAECGCLGNESCGHKPVDMDQCCTLDDVMVCPCCNSKFKASRLEALREDAFEARREDAREQKKRDDQTTM